MLVGYSRFLGIIWAVLALTSAAEAAYLAPTNWKKREWSEHHRKTLESIRALSDVRGKTFVTPEKPKAQVVVLLATQCPVSRRYMPRLGEIAKSFAEKGVVFRAIFPQDHDSLEEIKNFLGEFELPFTAVRDTDYALADQLFAERVPEVFVFDENEYLVYRGKIDDQYRINGASPAEGTPYLKRVLNQLVNVEEFTQKPTLAEGCLLSRKLSDKVEIAYDNYVGPLVHTKCAVCHQPGEIAGHIPLTNYEELNDYLSTVVERVEDRVMPPWRADRRWGHFNNDMRLDVNEIHALQLFAQTEAPQGKTKVTFKPKEGGAQWRMGTPDAVIPMSGPDSSLPDEYYQVPADGVIPYQHFRVKTNFSEDKWITGYEVRPSAPQVVHHANIFMIGPAQGGDWIFEGGLSKAIAIRLAKKKYGIDPAELEWVFKLYGPKLNRRLYMVGQYNPLLESHSYPDGYGFYLPKGSELIFEVHYTPNGKATLDKTSLALKFAPKVPEKADRREVYTRSGGHIKIDLPAQTTLNLTRSIKYFADAKLLNMRPHMHYRGTKFVAELESPDGAKQNILMVPKWDYEWQNNYEFSPPVDLKKGSILHLHYSWDNTPNNKNNPDPTQPVKFGLKIENEMSMSFPTYVYVNPDEADAAEEQLHEFILKQDQ